MSGSRVILLLSSILVGSVFDWSRIQLLSFGFNLLFFHTWLRKLFEHRFNFIEIQLLLHELKVTFVGLSFRSYGSCALLHAFHELLVGLQIVLDTQAQLSVVLDCVYIVQ